MSFIRKVGQLLEVLDYKTLSTFLFNLIVIKLLTLDYPLEYIGEVLITILSNWLQLIKLTFYTKSFFKIYKQAIIC